uniref:Uncharacterized protein n=1 Tax=Octopus bimaculoides TaxID=37653 RepID=A0A0L8FRJ2_OCTBM
MGCKHKTLQPFSIVSQHKSYHSCCSMYGNCSIEIYLENYPSITASYYKIK